MNINAQTLVKDIRPGQSSNPAYLINVNNTLFLVANDGTTGTELFKSDGTSIGTLLVAHINPGSGNGFFSGVVSSNNKLIFSAAPAFGQNELWISDGTSSGTMMVKDINPGTAASSPSYLTDINGTVFFAASDGINGTELWKSDGTDAGTLLVKDINVGSGNSSPRDFAKVNDMLFFRAASNGLWKSDGTDAGTVLVKASVIASDLINVNGTLFFQGIDGELWKSDGTDAGTVLVKDIYPGTSVSGPTYLTNMNGTLYFAATAGGSGASGRELWKSDGTESGTELVKDIYVGGNNGDPNNLYVVNNTLYFTAINGTNGRELWKTDGTEVGTIMVKDINPGSAASIPAAPASSYYFTHLDDTLFFSATDGTSGQELWKSDGTEVGTVLVGDINPGAGDSKPLWFTKVNNTIYFTAEESAFDAELWKYEAITGTTSINFLDNNQNTYVFPNPTNGILTINSPSENEVNKIEVYTILGNKVLEQEYSKLVDLSASPKGIYFVKIYGKKNIMTERIVVQ